MVNKEYVCMEETPEETQKKIRQWVSTGYTIEIVFQGLPVKNNATTTVVTSLYRTK